MSDIFSSKLEIAIVVTIMALILFLLHIHRKSILSPENTPKLGVKELVQQVKAELIEMDKKRLEANEAPLFVVNDFELEINFVVKEKTNYKGEFDFKVVTLGSDTDIGSEKTQKIKLRMSTLPPQNQTSAGLNEIEATSEIPAKSRKNK